ncbi:hypothetical protein AAVH_07078 [Aphelenchoides avenae]|nr:hypothetical protein AAVH_07078 [Aphelenchus avenae]
MQTDSPDDSLVREAIALLVPGAKDFTLYDLTAWIRQLEELCGSHDPALAPASFRTDISGSCRSTFPECGKKPSTTTQTTKLQTKDVKDYPSLPELHMEKVSSNKKTARGEANLRLSVDRGPVLVMLTTIDPDGATHTLRAVLEYIYDSKKDTMTVKSSGCSNPDCDEANCSCTPTTHTWNVKTGETVYTSDGRRVAPILQSFEGKRLRQLTLAQRGAAMAEEEKAIHEKLSTAKPAEKKRLMRELQKKNAQFAKLKNIMERTAEKDSEDEDGSDQEGSEDEDGTEQQDSKELNNVSIRTNQALLLRSVAYHQLS